MAMQASEVMSTTLVVVPPEMPVAAVVGLMAERGVSGLPVVDAAGTLLGLVTEGDLIRRLADEPPGPLGWFLGLFKATGPLIRRYAKARGRTARDVMTREVITVEADAPVERIAQLMERHNIRRVPVLREGRLAGLVSRADLLRAILQAEAAPAAPQPQDGPPPDDREIMRGVIRAMGEQPWTDTFWVFPDVREGVVTFHGFARSEEMREGLMLLASHVPGVRQVKDQLSPMPALLRLGG